MYDSIILLCSDSMMNGVRKTSTTTYLSYPASMGMHNFYACFNKHNSLCTCNLSLQHEKYDGLFFYYYFCFFFNPMPHKTIEPCAKKF